MDGVNETELLQKGVSKASIAYLDGLAMLIAGIASGELKLSDEQLQQKIRTLKLLLEAISINTRGRNAVIFMQTVLFICSVIAVIAMLVYNPAPSTLISTIFRYLIWIWAAISGSFAVFKYFKYSQEQKSDAITMEEFSKVLHTLESLNSNNINKPTR